jgi:hypothetical protein
MPYKPPAITTLDKIRGYLPAQCVECGAKLATCQQMLRAEQCPWKRNMLLTGHYKTLTGEISVTMYACESFQTASASPGR